MLLSVLLKTFILEIVQGQGILCKVDVDITKLHN